MDKPSGFGCGRYFSFFLLLQHSSSKRSLVSGCQLMQLATSSSVSPPPPKKAPPAVLYRYHTGVTPALHLAWPIRVSKYGCRTPITKRLSNLRSPGLTADPSTTIPRADFRCVASCCLSCRRGTCRSFDCDRRLAFLVTTKSRDPHHA